MVVLPLIGFFDASAKTLYGAWADSESYFKHFFYVELSPGDFGDPSARAECGEVVPRDRDVRCHEWTVLVLDVPLSDGSRWSESVPRVGVWRLTV